MLRGILADDIVNRNPSGAAGDVPADPPFEWRARASTKGADGTRPTSTEGTSVTPGVSGSRGSYANLGVLHATVDMLEIDIVVHTVGIATENRMISIDVALDLAGGTTFVDKITDLQVGAPGGVTQLSRWTYPLRVPAGASIGVRATSLNATTTAFRCYVNGRGDPSDTELVAYGNSVQRLGVPTPGTPGGTAITPGTTSEGAWFEIGTFAQNVISLEYGYCINNTVITSSQIDVDIAIGASDSTTTTGTKRIIIGNHTTFTTASEAVYRMNSAFRSCVGLAGEKVYARAQVAATLETGHSVAVHAVY